MYRQGHENQQTGHAMKKEPAKLLEATYDLLDAAMANGAAGGESQTKTLKDIAEGSGAGVEWMRKLLRRAIPNPGVIGVQAVYDYLSQPRVKNKEPTDEHR
jgi:hypothetical protein